jgi:hypothetical protein
MTLLKSVMVAAVLLTGGSSLAIAQNGPPTGGERPVAGGANGGGWGGGWYVALPATATATPTHACIATIGLTGATGIGINYQANGEGDYPPIH